MEFIDNTGHIFSLNSYDDKPLGLEYTEGDYIFWIKNSSVSINNYYIKPIRFLIEYDIIEDNLDDFDLEITNDSKFFKLISPRYLQHKLENISNISESIDLDKSCFVNKLTLRDFYFDKESFMSDENTENLIVYSNNNKFIMFPFYVISYSDIEGTFINNITIKYKYKSNKSITRSFTRNDLYDYLIKKTFSNINIYTCNENGLNKELLTTIYPGYDNNYIVNTGINNGLNKYEILYKSNQTNDDIVLSSLDENDIENKVNQKNRIRNFDNNDLPSDVYHYIYRLNYELSPGYYIFEGVMYEGCKYCGGVIGINHDGYNNDINYQGYIYEKFKNYNYYRLYEICNIDNNNYSKGYTLQNIPIYIDTPIADIWFDIDNERIISNEDGGIITEYLDAYKYTIISVGCSFIDECEELIINGKNMGIRLPKEILKAIYSSSYYAKYADEKLLRNKLKELLLNYMNIKGQCGNVKSMLNSLNWFGWNKYVKISKLLKTDNEFQNQFILDYFDIESDVKDIFKYFNHTNNISLSVLENNETGDNYEQNFNELFHGEGKPILEDLFNKNIEIIKENISYYKPYYNFIFNELALKLDCLKYYYQQYFLPVHINILRASINHKVYANTMKLSAYANDTLVDSPLYLLNNSNINVKFTDTDILLYKQNIHLIDSKYNEFSNYNNEYNKEDLYYVNENCISIPISIIDLNNEFSQDIYGDYFKENNMYYKINYFYKIISEDTVESSDRFNGTHYTLDGNINNIISLDQLPKRYIKISEGYFKCKLYLTVTYINQSDTGHYIYLNGHYIYKDNFYKYDMNDINLIENESIEQYIDDSFNYILYYNNYIKIDKKDRYDIQTIYLINNNDFIFYQNSNQYYKNFVIIPRIINNEIDWLNGYFRLSLSVNNKWFYYDFKIKIPNIYLDLGKLKYKYFLTETLTNNETTIQNEYYPFNQLISLNPLKFNSFMFQPDLITINSLFKDEKNDKLLTFVDKLLEVRNNEYTMAEFYKKYYRDKIIIPYNKKYFNRIHLFDIYDENNKKIEYDETDLQLYQILFNIDCSCKLMLNEKIYYDYYLMHDDKEWYIVAISQYPIASYIDESLLDIHQNIYIIGNYTIKYANYSVDKFLINRMDIVKSNGYNHFNVDDLIIASVNNNDYQFNIDLNNKWSINKIYDTKKIFEINNNSNIAIITNNNKDYLYTPGYYNIQLNYTINGLKNLFNHAIGEFKVEKTYQEIEYPAIKDITLNKEIFDIKDTISDGTILYVNEDGKRKFSKDYTTYFPGYHPIAIKIINAGYFEENSPAIYMGLKQLSILNPDNGKKELGNDITDIPYFGMQGKILNIKTYDKICYSDETHEHAINYLSVQTDNIDDKLVPKNSDGTLRYPAPNDRGFLSSRNAKYINENNITEYYSSDILNILNDDDTFRNELIDETCALSHWDGHSACQEIIDSFYYNNGEMICSEYDDWKTVETMYNPRSKQFSPAVACAWRYHTIGTKQGEWYVPSFAPVFFMSFNFKRYSEIFQNLNINYPNDCKPDLLQIGTSAFFTSTLPSTQTISNYNIWDIHVVKCLGHIFSRIASWYTIPFINIDEHSNNSNDDNLQTYTLKQIKNNESQFKNCIFKYENSLNLVLDNFLGITYDELLAFNEFNIAPSNANHFGIYTKRNEKIGILYLWDSLNSSNNNYNYKVGIISDVHYNDTDNDNDPDTYYDNNGTEYSEDLKNAFSFFNDNNIDFITCAGDITTDNIEHLNNFRRCFNKYMNNSSFYTCVGNHDTILKANYKDIWMNNDNINDKYNINRFNDEDGTSFWFNKNNDIYIFLNLEYGWENNNYNTHNCISLTTDDLLTKDTVDENDIHLYNKDTLQKFESLLEQYSNNRCFIFTHIMFRDKAGTYHGEENYYKYWETHSDVMKGDQGDFCLNLLNRYHNNYWFCGHSHYKWNWQKVDININITRSNNSYNVHIPSLANPLSISSGYTTANRDSEGAIMYVYNNYVDIYGIVFKENSNEYINKYHPLALYRIYKN